MFRALKHTLGEFTVLGDSQTVNPYSRGFYGAFHVLKPSRKGSILVSKHKERVGSTLAPKLGFTVQEDLGP